MEHHQNLTRRTTATDEDIINLIQRQPSISEEKSPTEVPDTSHKRKQSDVAFDNINIGQSDLRATFELERIDQGAEEDDDQNHPLRSPLISAISYNGSTTLQRPIFSSYPVFNARFIAALVAIASVATLGGMIRRSRGGLNDDGWGLEMVGDGLWFEPSRETDWLEYYRDPARLPKMGYPLFSF